MLRRSNSILSTPRAKSSDSERRMSDAGAIDRRLGRTVWRDTGDKLGELSLEADKSPSTAEREDDTGDGERYARLRGASLYLVSPDVRSGYSEPDFVDEAVNETLEGVSLAGGPRCTIFASFGSTGSGGLDMPVEDAWPPGVALRGTISRIDLDVKLTGARFATGGGHLGSARYPKEVRSGIDIGIWGGVALEGVETDEWGEWGS